jgi:hypothetical protein
VIDVEVEVEEKIEMEVGKEIEAEMNLEIEGHPFEDEEEI